MFKYTTTFIAIFCSAVFAQTFEWVDIVAPDYPYNPTYLHTPLDIDNSGNPVCARLVNFKEAYNQRTYGDVKIEKRNSTGSVLWENMIYGSSEVSELKIDYAGNLICIGTYRDTLEIDTVKLINPGSGTANFILKLDSNGNFTWIKEGTEFPANGVVTALESKASGNILVGVTNYSINASIYEFDTDGNPVSTIEQTDVTTISDISVDNSGNTWATGFAFGGQVSFNGLDTIAPFTYSEYVVKYNSFGAALWVNFIEDITVQDYNIVTDNYGNAYLSGNLFVTTQFGNLTANGPQWVYDFFVTKIDPDGNYLWLNEIPPGNPSGDGTIGNSNFISCGFEGDTYITGFFRGEIDFGNGIVIQPIGYADIFVISYNSGGEVQWAKAAGGDNYDEGCGIVTDNIGSCYVSGFVSQNAVFDTISTTGALMNLFITKLKYDSPVNVENEISDNVTADEFILMQNYPNPFNPTTKIQFVIPNEVRNPKDFSSQAPRNDNFLVTLKVYDVLGNEVATLVNEEKPAGYYEVHFDGSKLTSGIYFYKLRSGNFSKTNKMILIR